MTDKHEDKPQNENQLSVFGDENVGHSGAYGERPVTEFDGTSLEDADRSGMFEAGVNDPSTLPEHMPNLTDTVKHPTNDQLPAGHEGSITLQRKHLVWGGATLAAALLAAGILVSQNDSDEANIASSDTIPEEVDANPTEQLQDETTNTTIENAASPTEVVEVRPGFIEREGGFIVPEIRPQDAATPPEIIEPKTTAEAFDQISKALTYALNHDISYLEYVLGTTDSELAMFYESLVGDGEYIKNSLGITDFRFWTEFKSEEDRELDIENSTEDTGNVLISELGFGGAVDTALYEKLAKSNVELIQKSLPVDGERKTIWVINYISPNNYLDINDYSSVLSILEDHSQEAPWE